MSEGRKHGSASSAPPGLAEMAGIYPTGYLVPGAETAITRVQGYGGLSVVYAGELVSIGLPVALKVLHAHLRRTAYAARFVDEARLLAKLKHPNIVQVLNQGFTADRGLPFILMELLEGHSLRQFLETKKRLPIAKAIAIMIDVADGLAFAHQKNIIHRDLKPDNVVVDYSSGKAIVKIIDFGVGKYHDPNNREVLEIVEGTRAYMAPEQLRGAPPGAASDIYSFTVVLFELITGRRPTYQAEEKDDEDEKARKHDPSLPELDEEQKSRWLIYSILNEGPPTNIEEWVGEPIPQALAHLIVRGLEKIPELRPESMAEYAQELRVILQRLPPEQKVPTAQVPRRPMDSDTVPQPVNLLAEAHLAEANGDEPAPVQQPSPGIVTRFGKSIRRKEAERAKQPSASMLPNAPQISDQISNQPIIVSAPTAVAQRPVTLKKGLLVGVVSVAVSGIVIFAGLLGYRARGDAEAPAAAAAPSSPAVPPPPVVVKVLPPTQEPPNAPSGEPVPARANQPVEAPSIREVAPLPSSVSLPESAGKDESKLAKERLSEAPTSPAAGPSASATNEPAPSPVPSASGSGTPKPKKKKDPTDDWFYK